MEMAHRVPMVARRVAVAALLAVVSVGALSAQGTDTPAADQTQAAEGSSSSKKVPRKTPTNSRTAHHVLVPEDDQPPAELAQAEELIQKQDYAGAEPLLRKTVKWTAADGNAAGVDPAGVDPASYVAWFELGFVENALGKVDESIAAYRKSVAAKPDVFESNLNLGLQLAKTSQPDAEQFLRAATKLKPTSHVAEGKFRAWLSLAHVLEASKPDEAIAAY